MRNIILFLCIIIGGIAYADSSLTYTGSIPSTGQTVNSFEEILLNFDFSNVVETYGENENWGVGYAGYEGDEEEPEKSVRLYKGDVSSGELLAIEYTDIRKPNNAAFEAGNALKLSFPNIQVEDGQMYTVLVTIKCYAGIKGEKKYKTDTILNFFESPLELVFYGGADAKKVLISESNSIEENGTYEFMPQLNVMFNYDIKVNENGKIGLYEGSTAMGETTDITVDPSNNKTILVKFSEIPLYLDHTYNIVIPAGVVCLLNEDNILNEEIVIQIKGASYRYFGLGRGVTPPNEEVAILDEITVPFNFPKSDTTTYGIINKDEDPITVDVYAGHTTDGEPVFTISGDASADCSSLVLRPDYAFEPSSEYTFVIPEGSIKAYDIYDRNPTYLKDYISERIELHYTTPAVEDLPTWTPKPVNVKNDEEVTELKYIILDNPEYEFDGTIYKTVFNKNLPVDRKKAALYLVTEEGDQEILTFRFTRPTLDSSSEIGNGELEGQYFVGEVNETLYEGNQYKIVWFANDVVVDSPFIGRFIGNPEISIILKGATPISDDFGLKANVDDRLHSHADVFSFVTESEIKAGENAKMILKDGEESVAEAPVYVSREANGHRVYADFGGKKLENGKSYEVVLPEGSVYAANGIVNNPEIKSAITAMPETPAAPEYISVALNIDEYASATYRMVKGQESVLNLKAGDDWKLESLKLNGEDVTADVAENGLYTLPALEENANLDATYAYAHEINYDYETGVGNLEDIPYSLSKDGSHVIISGLNGGEQIAIYTMGGMKIASLDTVPADMHEASIALPEGQIYIVMINNTSIKWKH